jgi:predicted small secreted protein
MEKEEIFIIYLRRESMEKHKLVSMAVLTLCILLAAGINTAKGVPKEIKVEIHVVKGSGITEEQVRDWIEKTNEADKPYAKFVVDSNHVYDANSTYDSNDNDLNEINIWVRPRCIVTGEPNIVSGQKGNIVEVVPGSGPPSGPGDPNVFIKDTTLAHELNHVLGLDHNDLNNQPITDPCNKMFPDVDDHNGTKPLHSCHRIGKKLAPWQQMIIGMTASNFANNAALKGHGHDVYDAIGDVGSRYIDLDWAQSSMEWSGMYLLHLIAQVQEISFTDYSKIGFYIEADSNSATGQPPEGLDYRVAYRSDINEITLEMYNGGSWEPLDANEITCQFTYTDKDADIPPVPSGVKFDLPLSLLQTAAGDHISYKAFAQNTVETDFAPNTGLLTIKYPPQWPPDLFPDGVIDGKDLHVLAENWLLSPPMNPDTDLFPDGQINFRDFAEFAVHWRRNQP